MSNTVLKMFQLQGSILVLLVLGYFFGKKDILDSHTRKKMTTLILQLILPCNIFLSFVSRDNTQILDKCIYILAVSVFIQILLCGFSRLSFRKKERQERACLQYGLICSNATFMGIPIIESVYGIDGILFASIAVLPLRVIMWTEGIALFSPDGKQNAALKLIKNPCILAVVVGLVFMLTPLQVPIILYDSISYLSRCTSALIMLIIGAMFCEIKIGMDFDKTNFQYCILRLLVIPGAVYVVGKLIGLAPVLHGVLVIMQGMPMATTGVMLAEEYGADSEFASRQMFASTLFSALTIPLFIALLS